LDVLKAGTTFAGRYSVVRIISAGGMGVVYEVVHNDTQRRRALKVMLPSALADDDMRQRFRREAVVTATVESEHIVEVFDAGVEAESGAPFLVMELLRGEDLGSRLQKRGTLPAADVVEILSQVARGLDRTHAAGIVHRDLKPENVFLAVRDDGSPRVKILDFGIAKLVSRTQGKSTRSLGTPLYMAPEQISGVSTDIGPAADLYALAHLAFSMLAGQPYFQPEAAATDNVLALLFHIVRGAPDPATKRAAALGVELPKSFDAWFARAASIEPQARYRSAGEMIRALGERLRGVDADVGGGPNDAVAARTAAADGGESADVRSAGPADAATGPTLPVELPAPRKLGGAAEQSVDVVPGGTGDLHESLTTSPPASSRTVADVGRAKSRSRWGVIATGAAALVGLVAVVATQGGSTPSARQASAVAAASDGERNDEALAAGGVALGAESPLIEPTNPPLASASASASASAAVASATAAPSGKPAPPPLPKVQPTAGGPAPPPTAAPPVWGGPRR